MAIYTFLRGVETDAVVAPTPDEWHRSTIAKTVEPPVSEIMESTPYTTTTTTVSVRSYPTVGAPVGLAESFPTGRETETVIPTEASAFEVLALREF